jgi:hypothetical protein
MVQSLAFSIRLLLTSDCKNDHRVLSDCFEVRLNVNTTTDYTNVDSAGSGPIDLDVNPSLLMSAKFKDVVVKSSHGDSGA